MTTGNSEPATYIPGVCNIGPAERAQRRQIGTRTAAVAVGLFLILLITHAPKPWRLLLFIPLFGAASALLQDAMHFCAGFGFRGVYNVLNDVGDTDDVVAAGFRKQDQRKALQITGLAAVIGATATAVLMAV